MDLGERSRFEKNVQRWNFLLIWGDDTIPAYYIIYPLKVHFCGIFSRLSNTLYPSKSRRIRGHPVSICDCITLCVCVGRVPWTFPVSWLFFFFVMRGAAWSVFYVNMIVVDLTSQSLAFPLCWLEIFPSMRVWWILLIRIVLIVSPLAWWCETCWSSFTWNFVYCIENLVVGFLRLFDHCCICCGWLDSLFSQRQ